MKFKEEGITNTTDAQYDSKLGCRFLSGSVPSHCFHSLDGESWSLRAQLHSGSSAADLLIIAQ